MNYGILKVWLLVVIRPWKRVLYISNSRHYVKLKNCFDSCNISNTIQNAKCTNTLLLSPPCNYAAHYWWAHIIYSQTEDWVTVLCHKHLKKGNPYVLFCWFANFLTCTSGSICKKTYFNSIVWNCIYENARFEIISCSSCSVASASWATVFRAVLWL